MHRVVMCRARLPSPNTSASNTFSTPRNIVQSTVFIMQTIVRRLKIPNSNILTQYQLVSGGATVFLDLLARSPHPTRQRFLPESYHPDCPGLGSVPSLDSILLSERVHSLRTRHSSLLPAPEPRLVQFRWPCQKHSTHPVPRITMSINER
jgi:hypothetical protein